MIALNLAFPLLYWEATPTLLIAYTAKLLLEFWALSLKKPKKIALLHLLILTLLYNYIGTLLVTIPPFLEISTPFLLVKCPPPQALPYPSLLLSIFTPFPLVAFLSKKVLSHDTGDSLTIGGISSLTSVIVAGAYTLQPV